MTDTVRQTPAEAEHLVPVHFDGQVLNKICKETLASEGDKTLLDRLQKAYPEYPLRIARLGHEWYRLGGIIKSDGTRIAQDSTEWAERTYIECGQDFQTLLDHCEDENFLVTQHVGVSLYLVAQTGPRAEDFVQIEVDRTQELAHRYLIDTDNPPDDLEELIDPINPVGVEPFTVGASRYTYRRKTDVALFMQELGRHRADPHPAQRFMDDWNASSAGRQKAFCDDWSLRLYQHVGRHGEQIMNVEIVHNRIKDIPRLEGPEGKKGKALASLIGRFDHQAGFPFAWYFYMLKGLVSPHVGEAVSRDLAKDYAYLPDCDTAVLKHWAAMPYCL
ncbi:hypothetical protein [Methylococcus sp. EFPC2]|uniref:hypothetical protein n=1 Tax=Methylococcus sp. EFPC2 TaxID=2812648 RepID=UPI00196895A3|nr:hypothetical protein [Methylococcus sp. EFPC2]QSA99253.1 hypothetical protein JWZ97_19715 [Methylococcus sp. EFPC2]